MTILDEIIAYKKKELAQIKSKASVRDLEMSRHFNRETVSLSRFLLDKTKTGIIAEFKRKSPSRGMINPEASVQDVSSGYSREGASGISILTDNHFFGGTSADLSVVRENNKFPILRKDFVFDEYQVIESKAIGADSVLLIASVITKPEIQNLAQLARSLGLEVLFEVHDEKELDMVNQYINIIGVNNRNLKTFEVNTEISEKIAEQIPAGFVKISESGITSPEILNKLRIAGYNGFLMGEKFMCTPDPVKAFAEFVKLIIMSND